MSEKTKDDDLVLDDAIDSCMEYCAGEKDEATKTPYAQLGDWLTELKCRRARDAVMRARGMMDYDKLGCALKQAERLEECIGTIVPHDSSPLAASVSLPITFLGYLRWQVDDLRSILTAMKDTC